jgi:catechol 2,3-dioxygenase-like lactoylglutathione lyase family enzyme
MNEVFIQTPEPGERYASGSRGECEYMITYHSVVLICSDMKASRAFYQNHFHLEVELDLGGLVSFKGGISLWSREIASGLLYWGADPSPPQQNPMQEIYFETDDIDGFIALITKEGIRLMHPVQLTPWHQKTVRFFDPDGHLIEVGESMEEIIRRPSGSLTLTAT